uniref:Zinc finger protein 333 n=1 Tax=Theropithecus gelada TaxID=9565 RepID=A0A8D2ERT3_THEGE
MESVTLEDVAVEFIQEWALLDSARRSLCRYGMLDQCRTLTSRGAGAVPEDAAGALYRSKGDTIDSRGPASSPGAALVSGMHGTEGCCADSEGVDTSAYAGPPRPVGGRGFWEQFLDLGHVLLFSIFLRVTPPLSSSGGEMGTRKQSQRKQPLFRGAHSPLGGQSLK